MRLQVKHLLVLLAGTMLSACALFGVPKLIPLWYSAEPIEAWVVDKHTGQPIEDAIVVAHWVLRGGWEGGWRAEMVVKEAVTDKSGRFFISAWGPQRTPWGVESNARFQEDAPEIIVFKSGYRIEAIRNRTLTTAQSADDGPSIRRSDWAGKQIPLEVVNWAAIDIPGGLGERIAPWPMEFTRFNYAHFGFFKENPMPCAWENIPRMIEAMRREKERLVAMGFSDVRSFYDSLKGHSALTEKGCKSVEQLLEEQKK